MTSMERVLAAAGGVAHDRPPAVAVLSAYGARVSGVGLDRLFREPGLYSDAQLALRERFDLDALLAPFDYSAIAEAWSGELLRLPDHLPQLRVPGCRSLDAALAHPVPAIGGRLADQLDAVRRLAAAASGSVPVLAAVPGPCIMPTLAMGLEAWLGAFLEEPVRAEQLLERTTAFWLDWCRELFAAGVTVLVLTEGFATSEILTRDLFAERCRARLSAALEALPGPVVIHSTGGSLGHVADLLAGLPRLFGLAIGAFDNPVEIRGAVGPALPLLGNLDNIELARLDPATARVRAREILAAAVPAGPFILANSGGDIPPETPAETIAALAEAAWEYGPVPERRR
jgi:uroporphyrinogen-III decarboxylase